MERTAAGLLDPVVETLLIPLHYRAMESARADALLRDPRAAELARSLQYSFTSLENKPGSQLFIVLRARHFDRSVAAFVSAHPGSALVVEIGCGLDTRYERLGRPPVPWYNLDLPDAMELRSRLLGESPGCTDLVGPALEHA